MGNDELRKTVVLVTGRDRRELVRQALLALGEKFEQRAKAAKKIFIHPNLVTPHRQAASTHVEAVRGVVDHLSLIRDDEILIGDASYYETKKAFHAFGYETLKRSGNVRLVDLNDDETVESFAYAPLEAGRHGRPPSPQDGPLTGYTADLKKRPIGFSKTVAESDFNIVVVPAKMHSYGIVSLAVKTHVIGSQVVKASPFGIHGRWPWNHTGYKPFHLTLVDVYVEHPAHLAIIDGTQAMEGEGPTSGREVNLGWLIASLNPVAADALAVYLMGIDPQNIGYLCHLNQKGFGPIEPVEMYIIGPGGRASGPELVEGFRRELARPDSYPEILNWR